MAGVLELEPDLVQERVDALRRVVERERVQALDHAAQRSARGLDRDEADHGGRDEGRGKNEQDQLRGQTTPRGGPIIRGIADACRGR
jgi:hypothetical protein